MEKYNSENAVLSVDICEVPHESFLGDTNNYKIDNHSIKFNKEDSSTGIEIKVKDLVDFWLETLQPEQQSKLELEETTRIEKRELATQRRKKEQREEDAKKFQVQGMLKSFLAEQILKVLKEKGLGINKSNIRSLIRECKEYSWYHSNTKYQYNPMGILFTDREWNMFREQCNKIHKKYGYFDDYENAVQYGITTDLTELRDAPISDWK